MTRRRRYITDPSNQDRIAKVDATGSLQVGLSSPLEANGAVPVNIQDQHSKALDLDFLRALAAPTTLNGAVSAEDTQLTVTLDTGFAVGEHVLIAGTGTSYYTAEVTAKAGNLLTLDTPIDIDYADGSSIIAMSNKMNVVGSRVAPIVFQIGSAQSAWTIDITRIMGHIVDDTAMDDAKFGGITALTNGIVLRRNDGVITNYWNAKDNGKIRLICFDANYASKAPAGFFGFNFRNTYGGQSKHGVTIRLEAGETLELLVQDDLTGLTSFNMMAQGHFVTD